LADLHALIGSEIGVTDWIPVEQDAIDQFSVSTRDPDWLHVDPERAKRDGPYGGTIAFGFWTLSMLTYCSHQVGMWPKDVAYALNYGLDRVRWINPVPVGTRIRMRCKLLSLEERPDLRILVRTLNTMEIEGGTRPAMTAEWLGLFIHKRPDSPP
jgi:acyl dehydratase